MYSPVVGVRRNGRGAIDAGDVLGWVSAGKHSWVWSVFLASLSSREGQSQQVCWHIKFQFAESSHKLRRNSTVDLACLWALMRGLSSLSGGTSLYALDTVAIKANDDSCRAGFRVENLVRQNSTAIRAVQKFKTLVGLVIKRHSQFPTIRDLLRLHNYDSAAPQIILGPVGLTVNSLVFENPPSKLILPLIQTSARVRDARRTSNCTPPPQIDATDHA